MARGSGAASTTTRTSIVHIIVVATIIVVNTTSIATVSTSTATATATVAQTAPAATLYSVSSGAGAALHGGVFAGATGDHAWGPGSATADAAALGATPRTTLLLAEAVRGHQIARHGAALLATTTVVSSVDAGVAAVAAVVVAVVISVGSEFAVQRVTGHRPAGVKTVHELCINNKSDQYKKSTSHSNSPGGSGGGVGAAVVGVRRLRGITMLLLVVAGMTTGSVIGCVVGPVAVSISVVCVLMVDVATHTTTTHTATSTTTGVRIERLSTQPGIRRACATVSSGARKSQRGVEGGWGIRPADPQQTERAAGAHLLVCVVV